jgi:Flp pilus assembly pilin Flp
MFWYPQMLLQMVRLRAQALRADEGRDRGASAIEWAIIAAITVVAAVLIGGVVYNIVQSKSTKLQDCGNAAPGATNC